MLRVLCAFVLLTAAAEAERQTAFRAFAVLPVDASGQLSRIAACEGTPWPERWHFIVRDPAQENGLRDYVVEDGRVVARNGVSQFAREVRAEDVLPPRSVQVDSDRVAVIASHYAEANGLAPASMNYELRKEPFDDRPMWKVTCLDSKNRVFGWLVLDAATGVVVARGGFSRVPLSGGFTGEPLPNATRGDLEEVATPRPRATPVRSPRRIEVRRAEPVEPPRRIVVDPFRAVRGLLPF